MLLNHMCGSRESLLTFVSKFQVALAEIHKLLPELLRQFDMRMAHDEPWKTRNAGFIKQSNVIVKLKERI